jgi:hypothetical protein
LKTQPKIIMALFAMGALILPPTAALGSEESSLVSVNSALQTVTQQSLSTKTDVLRNVAYVATDSVGQDAIQTNVNGVNVTIPTNPSNQVQMRRDGSPGFSIQLPFSSNASSVEVVDEGFVSYDNRNFSSTAAVLKQDGSLQVLSIIESSTAPISYEYSFALPEGAAIIRSGGGLLIINADGLVAAVAPAWALDAEGQEVPSHYVVSGQTIIQIVDHRSEDYSYPVVADPWIGIALFSSISVDTYQRQPRVNLDLSAWGWLVWTGAAQGGGLFGFGSGQAILNTAGWDEAWGKGGSIRSALDKPSQREQFSCHALGAIAAGTWNLEKFRPNRVNGNWFSGVETHRCNWTTSNAY